MDPFEQRLQKLEVEVLKEQEQRLVLEENLRQEQNARDNATVKMLGHVVHTVSCSQAGTNGPNTHVAAR